MPDAAAELGAVLYRFGWEKLIVFGVNTFVVAFIFFQVVSERRRNIRKQAKPSSEVNSPPDPFTRRSQAGFHLC